MYPANSYAIRPLAAGPPADRDAPLQGAVGEGVTAMPFPRDPNAPGGPRRSEYVRASVAARPGPEGDRPAEAEVSVRLSTVEGDDDEVLHRLASLHDRPAPRGPVVLA
jgi:hypothetical protein